MGSDGWPLWFLNGVRKDISRQGAEAARKPGMVSGDWWLGFLNWRAERYSSLKRQDRKETFGWVRVVGGSGF